jgi:hypothetical protein
VHRLVSRIGGEEFEDPSVRLEFFQPFRFIVGHPGEEGMVVGTFDGIIGIDLDIAEMFDEFADGFAALAELGRAGQACGVEDDLSGLRCGKADLLHAGQSKKILGLLYGIRLPRCLYVKIFINFKVTCMQKFMLIIKEDLAELEKMGDDERQRCIRVMTAWVESLQESVNFLGGNPLEVAGRFVVRDRVISDGPFMEAKEGISGYILLDAENLEQAAAIAQGCPFVQDGRMAIEVRPIYPTINAS